MIYIILNVIYLENLEEHLNYLQDCVFFNLITAYNKIMYLFNLIFITTIFSFSQNYS